MRLFINDNRISTAVKTKSGSLLQVYPRKKQFADEVEWQNHWAEATKPKIILRFGDEEEKKSAPAPVPAAPKTSPLDDWTVNTQSNFSFTLPAGTYYIGDLCYALSDDVYHNIFGGMGYSDGIYQHKSTGHTFALAPTAWGDGAFKGSDGKVFGVDAGMIGICSVALKEKSGYGGHVYTFETPVKCHFKVGRFSFFWGHYNSLDIDTE